MIIDCVRHCFVLYAINIVNNLSTHNIILTSVYTTSMATDLSCRIVTFELIIDKLIIVLLVISVSNFDHKRY